VLGRGSIKKFIGNHEVFCKVVFHVPCLNYMILSAHKFWQRPQHFFHDGIEGKQLHFPSFIIDVNGDYSVYCRHAFVEECILLSPYSTEIDDSSFESSDDSTLSCDQIVGFGSSVIHQAQVELKQKISFPIIIDFEIDKHICSFGSEVFISYHHTSVSFEDEEKSLWSR